jgi:proliferating cell nuclear antigen
MSFKITVAKAKTLQDIATVIGVVTDEATLRLTADGLHFESMDSGKVALLQIHYPPSAFQEYNCPAESTVSFNVTNLRNLLKRAGKDDKATMEQQPDGKLLLIFEEAMQGENVKPKIRRFQLPTLSINPDPTPEIKLVFQAKASVTIKSLLESVEDAQVVGDFLQLTAEQGKLSVSTRGDLMDADSTLQEGNPALLAISASSPQTAIYSVLYTLEILKATKELADAVDLEFSTDIPLKMTFQLHEDSITFVLAPRIDQPVGTETE